MDKSDRLTQFLEWVAARPSSPVPAGDLSRVGAALLEESGGGRVTEAHILSVGDHLGGDHAQLALVHDCGDLFLRFEEAQRQAGAPALAPPKRPRGSAAALTPPAFPVEVPPPPAAPAAPAAAPAVAAERPPDVQPPLRPPERIGTHGEAVLAPSPVTFTRPSAPGLSPTGPLALPLPSPRETQPVAPPPGAGPRDSQRITAGREPGPAPAVPSLGSIVPAVAQRTAGVSSTGELRKPGVRDSQRLTRVASAFRCPACAIMVEADPDGKCPKCGGNPPHAIAMPSASALSPAAVRAPGERGVNWLALGAIVAVAVVGSMVGIKWGRMACDANRGASVAGEASIDRLGVHMFFPPGWRQHKAVDQVQPITRDITARALAYYRGDDSDDPELGMVLTVADRLPLPPEQQRALSEADFRQIVDGVSSSMGSRAELQPCEVVNVGLRRTGRCIGEMTDHGRRRRIAIYIWMMEPRLGVAMFVGRVPVDKLVAEADDIVGTIEPRARAPK